MTDWVLVVGATGYFGRLLVEDLLSFTDCGVVVCSRRRKDSQALAAELSKTSPGRIRFTGGDLNEPTAWAAALKGVFAAICAAGPFQGMPLSLLEACLTRGVHYLDLADDRDFVRRALEKARERSGKTAVCPGWSTAPALTAILAKIAATGMDKGIDISSQIAPGHRAPRNVGTVLSLLHSTGKPMRLWSDNAWRDAWGWSEPKVFRFPEPVGTRTGFLVNVPDYDLFPDLFNARSVSFRAGAEFAALNAGTSVLAALSRHKIVSDWSFASGFLRSVLAITSVFGHDSGAVGVEVHGTRNGRPTTSRASVTAAHEGQRIPVMPASFVISALKRGTLDAKNSTLDSWITRTGLADECVKRGWALAVDDE